MEFNQYLRHFKAILDANQPQPPFDNPDYMKYTKINWSRMNRWLKNGALSKEIVQAIQQIQAPQIWVLITEPWCGDAAHSVPFIVKMAQLNGQITLEIQLRDTDSEIEQYRTRGGKSIPKLIIRDASGKDLATWGPRPEPCQVIYDGLMAAEVDFDTLILELQKWYNKDKGRLLQKELLPMLTQ